MVLTALTAAACSRTPEPKEYEVKGQILRVDPVRQKVLVDHEDIEGFMPAMTMPYKARTRRCSRGRRRATRATSWCTICVPPCSIRKTVS